MMDLRKLLCDIQNIKTKDQCRDVWYKYRDQMTSSSFITDIREKDKMQLINILKACIIHAHSEIMLMFVNEILKLDEFLAWKENPDILGGIFDTLGSCEKQDERTISHMTRNFLKIAEDNKLISKIKPNLYGIYESAVVCDAKTNVGHVIVKEIHYPWNTEDEEKIKQLLRLIYKGLGRDPSCCTGDWNKITASTLKSILCAVKSPLSVNISEKVLDIFNFSFKQLLKVHDATRKGKAKTISCIVCEIILDDYLLKLKDHPKCLHPFMGGVRELWNGQEPNLQSLAHKVMIRCADNFELIGDDADVLIDLYLTGQDFTLISSFIYLYKQVPKKFLLRIDDFITCLLERDKWNRSCCLSLFKEIAFHTPSQFPPELVKAIFSLLEDSSNAYNVWSVLFPLSQKNPAVIIPYDDDIIQAMKEFGAQGHCDLAASILLNLVKNEEQAWKYCRVFAEFAKKAEVHSKVTWLNYMCCIGRTYRSALEEYRPLLLQLKENPQLRQTVEACLNIIDGKNLETMYDTLASGKAVLDELSTRIEMTEDNVDNLAREVQPKQQKGMDQNRESNENKDQWGQPPDLLADMDKVVQQSWPYIQPLVEQLVVKHTQPLQERLVQMDKYIEKLEKRIVNCKCKQTRQETVKF